MLLRGALVAADRTARSRRWWRRARAGGAGPSRGRGPASRRACGPGRGGGRAGGRPASGRPGTPARARGPDLRARDPAPFPPGHGSSARSARTGRAPPGSGPGARSLDHDRVEDPGSPGGRVRPGLRGGGRDAPEGWDGRGALSSGERCGVEHARLRAWVENDVDRPSDALSPRRGDRTILTSVKDVADRYDPTNQGPYARAAARKGPRRPRPLPQSAPEGPAMSPRESGPAKPGDVTRHAGRVRVERCEPALAHLPVDPIGVDPSDRDAFVGRVRVPISPRPRRSLGRRRSHPLGSRGPARRAGGPLPPAGRRDAVPVLWLFGSGRRPIAAVGGLDRRCPTFPGVLSNASRRSRSHLGPRLYCGLSSMDASPTRALSCPALGLRLSPSIWPGRPWNPPVPMSSADRRPVVMTDSFAPDKS